MRRRSPVSRNPKPKEHTRGPRQATAGGRTHAYAPAKSPLLQELLERFPNALGPRRPRNAPLCPRMTRSEGRLRKRLQNQRPTALLLAS
jgi:hypothetical protein